MIRIKKEKKLWELEKMRKVLTKFLIYLFLSPFLLLKKRIWVKILLYVLLSQAGIFFLFFLRLILSLLSTWKFIPAPLQGHFPQILFFLPLSLSQWLENNPKAWSFLRSCTSLKSHVDICTVFIFSMSFVEKTTITPVTYKYPKSVQNDQIMSRHKLFAKSIFWIGVKLSSNSSPVWAFN